MPVALVVTGGVLWVVGAALYGIQVATCMSCGSVVLAPGVSTAGYPTEALRTLGWDDLYANLYVATVGVLAVAIGLTAFRRGERWAWYAIGVFVLAAILTSMLDELSWAAGTPS